MRLSRHFGNLLSSNMENRIQLTKIKATREKCAKSARKEVEYATGMDLVFGKIPNEVTGTVTPVVVIHLGKIKVMEAQMELELL